MEQRFKKLTVGLVPPTITNRSHERIVQQLISYYRPFRVYSLFGSASVDYLCGLATRYAYATLQKDDVIAMKAYALWLSLIWLIDGYFDKCRPQTSVSDIETLIKIFNLEDIGDTKHPIFEVSVALYAIYLDLITPYCMGNLPAFSSLTGWLIRYLKTLSVPTTPRESHKKSNSDGSPRVITLEKIHTLLEYTKWRLNSGAMMCVVWHLMLFNRLTPRISSFRKIFEMAAIAVSYHNDIISYNRDLRQKTPNLVSTIKNESDDDFNAMNKAIMITNGLYSKIAKEFSRVCLSEEEKESETVGYLVLDILEGSYSWAYAEPRYDLGIKMLRALKANDKRSFYALLFDQRSTPGDPKKRIKVLTKTTTSQNLIPGGSDRLKLSTDN